ncbi:MAG TPA: tRNA dihydrouridine synthase DusB [Bacteroidales bacterium]|nr:tRNA dihydrouridine synthase DusB [Bacteroidota bacterium]HJN06233.1 tRNA dihydrouridine synthase DusB [Bacteroidales bacterium]
MVKIDEISLGEFPILLAPMEDVTDPPFRYVCKMFGADMMFTEFISSEGLIRDAAKSVKKLDFEEFERPIGIQIFGHDIDSMVKAAQYAERANPDLIDINYGCPVKKVVTKGAGAGILNDIPKMVKMTQAVVNSVTLPVTVKTRLGYDDEHKEIVEIAERIQDVGVKAITIHGRTRTQKPRIPADWTLIGEVKNNPRMHIPVFGNGDVVDAVSAKYFKDNFGVDGLMVARGVYGNPWIFNEIKHYLKTGEILPAPDIEERIRICTIQLEKSVEWKGERRGVLEIRKHWGDYFKGYPNFKPFRLKIMNSDSLDEILIILQEIKLFYS